MIGLLRGAVNCQEQSHLPKGQLLGDLGLIGVQASKLIFQTMSALLLKVSNILSIFEISIEIDTKLEKVKSEIVDMTDAK